MNSYEAASRLAQELNDNPLTPIKRGFVNQVYMGRSNVYKVCTALNRLQQGFHLKEKRILHLLANYLDKQWKHVIPTYVGGKQFEGVGFVQVHSKLPGSHPSTLTRDEGFQLGNFLTYLHRVSNFSCVDEFLNNDEKKEPRISFDKYLLAAVDNYSEQLRKNVTKKEWELIVEAAYFVRKNLIKHNQLVLVHKDLHLNNILTCNGKITGVIDWEAAQTAPYEWELSILLQRLPNNWDSVIEGYGKTVNFELLQICGIVQCLRFWKSFPEHNDFVIQQKNFLKQLINREAFSTKIAIQNVVCNKYMSEMDSLS